MQAITVNEPKKTVFLHIGWHKTGTTSIQALLSLNQKTFEDHLQLLYPKTGHTGNAHHGLSHSLIHSDSSNTYLWLQLVDELQKNTHWKTAIISAESLSIATKDDIEAIASVLLPHFTIKIICYVRQPDRWIEAVFSQRVKEGHYIGNWKDFWKQEVQNNRPDYLNSLRTWKKSFGKENLIIRPYDSQSWKNEDLLCDFFNAIGLKGVESISGVNKPEQLNVSPDVTNLSIVREISRRFKKGGIDYTGQFLNVHLSKAIQRNLNQLNREHQPALFFSSKERIKLRKKYQSTFKELGVEFFDDNPRFKEPEQNELPDYDLLPQSDINESLYAAICELRVKLSNRNILATDSKLYAPLENPTPQSEQLISLIVTLLSKLPTDQFKDISMFKKIPSPNSSLSSHPQKEKLGPEIKPSLYIHIGHEKVGSTTIQQSLIDNIDNVRSEGLLVADRNLDFNESGDLLGYPMNPFRHLLEKDSCDIPPSQFKQKMEALQTTLLQGSYRGAVISSEILSRPEAAKLFEPLAAIFNIHTIYYVRRQDEWIESAWKQWGIKEGHDLNAYADMMIQKNRPNYLEVAKAWSKISDSMHVKPINGIPDISKDFWRAIGINDFSPPITPPKNQTFDWAVLDILSQNPYLFSDVDDNTIFNLLDKLLPNNAPRSGHGLLSPDLVKKVMDSQRTSNDLLHAEFFPDCKPLYQYPSRPFSMEAKEGRGGFSGIQRYLGMELLMFGTLLDQQHSTSKNLHDLNTAVCSLSTHVQHSLLAHSNDRIRDQPHYKTDIHYLKKSNTELRKENKFLLRKVDEIEGKMARSFTWRFKKLYRKIKKAISKKNVDETN